jgi:hypothetical protein
VQPGRVLLLLPSIIRYGRTHTSTHTGTLANGCDLPFDPVEKAFSSSSSSSSFPLFIFQPSKHSEKMRRRKPFWRHKPTSSSSFRVCVFLGSSPGHSGLRSSSFFFYYMHKQKPALLLRLLRLGRGEVDPRLRLGGRG